MRKKYAVAAMLSASLILPVSVGHAQAYPSRPIRVITSPIGGGSDFAARLIALGVAGPLGQSVIVDNRSETGIETMAKASPDGYTLLYYGSVVWLMHLLRERVAWDPIKDFAAVTLAVSAPNVLVVHSSVPAKSVAELIALAKSKPGALNFPTGGTGSSSSLAAVLFRAMAGINVVEIPFAGSGPALLSIVSNESQFMFPSAGGAAPHIKSGRLRALAVSSAEPSALVPGLPTVAASGLPGYESVQMSGLFTQAKTPAAIIRRLNQETVRFLSTKETKERFLAAGVEVVASTPDEFASKIKSEIARMSTVIKKADIREK